MNVSLMFVFSGTGDGARDQMRDFPNARKTQGMLARKRQ